jgi:uncharacterized membrane protein YcaP (DUF421 family)
MNSVVRGLVMYLFLLLLFRVTGKRSLAQITTFDAVLLLIISEAVQQGLIGIDQSMVNAFLLVITLVGADVALSLLTARSERLNRLLNDVPLVLVDDGRVLEHRMRKARVTVADILERARELQGLERLDQIKYAVLERGGAVTVIPRR